MNKVWTKDQIVALLQNDAKAVQRGIVAIYQRQMDDEKSNERTYHQNGVGFNSSDAAFLSSLAVRLKSRGLTPKQFECGKKAIMKYAGQLTKIANEKARIEKSK